MFFSCLAKISPIIAIYRPIISFHPRFVGPFLGLVQTWERRLALVSEIIDEWIATQRKWMYLEGIFIGGDMRAQLPDEAAKFDVIDSHLKKVSIHFSIMYNLILSFKKVTQMHTNVKVKNNNAIQLQR